MTLGTLNGRRYYPWFPQDTTNAGIEWQDTLGALYAAEQMKANEKRMIVLPDDTVDMLLALADEQDEAHPWNGVHTFPAESVTHGDSAYAEPWQIGDDVVFGSPEWFANIPEVKF